MPVKGKNFNKDNAPAAEAMSEEEVAAAQELPDLLEGAEVVEPDDDPPFEIEEKADFIPCAYAGDPEDKVCCKCDGLTYDGGPADQTCLGYTAELPQAPEVEKPAPKVKVTKPKPPAQEKGTKQSEEAADPGTVSAQCKTTSIRAEISITEEVVAEHGGKVWLKASYSEMRAVPENMPQEQIAEETAILWEDVEAEVKQKMEDLIADY